ncbi:MAG: PAS domain S-box protein [Methanoregula sp.]|jgi:PAS domain S-box-containing protein|nr:PAS domain S-box protein [Methanoregula sp.]
MTVDDGSGCIEAGILENALVMIAVLEKSGKIIAWNHAAETITGYSSEEVIGDTTVWKKLYPEEKYRDSVTTRIAVILKEKNYFENFETTIRTKTGVSRIILWNTKEISSGGKVRVITAGLDITRQKELDAFRESVVENANVLIMVLGRKGEVILWNTAAEEITGYPRAEVVGSREIWKQLYPDPAYRKTVTRKITDIIASQRYFENLDTTIMDKSGETRVISWNTREIGAGTDRLAIAIGRDITEQRKAEMALVAYMTEMAMRIRQPIGIIRDNLRDVTELIRAKKISPEETALLLDGQVRNASQVMANVQEFQKAILEKNRAIPEAYRKFLEGD